jgi:hypothetical protein
MLAVIGTAAVVWQRISMADGKQQLQATPAANSESNASSAGVNSETEHEAVALRAQTRDLAKLRNEVSQLRAQQSELAAARAESARLLDAKGSGAPLRREVPPGFISKEQLRNAGFQTPEDAVQTFFWAMREGDLGLMAQGLSPGNEERKEIERMPPEKRAELEKMLRAEENRKENPMNYFNDFAVRGKEVISDDAVVLHIGSSLSMNTAKVKLERSAGEWRLHDIPK